MRVQVSALLALVSAAAYVACGSNDNTRIERAAGAGGQGDAGAAGEHNTLGGSQNNAGTLNMGGEAGTPAGGVGGEQLGGAGGSDVVGGAAGAGGEAQGGAPATDLTPADGLPKECPGSLDMYTLKDGTSGVDQYLQADLNGRILAFGEAGNDVFGEDYAGDDCLIGGPGDDQFTSSGEANSYFFGGTGADTYHVIWKYGYLHIADMEAADTIALSKDEFPFLTGNVGEHLAAGQLVSVAGYGTGADSGTNLATLVYDPSTGELYQDLDGGKLEPKMPDDRVVGHILNYGTYKFDPNDFVLDP